MKNCISALIIAMTSLLLALHAKPAVAQSDLSLAVEEGKGRVVRLNRPAANIFIGDPSIISVQSVNTSTLFVSGVTTGVTNLIVLDSNDQLVGNFRVSVRGDLGEAGATLRDAIPAGVSLDQAGNTVIIKGYANSYQDALAILDAERILEADGRRVLNRAQLNQPNQVMLRVRFVEVSRSSLRSLGVDLNVLRDVNNSVFQILTGSGLATSIIDGGSATGIRALAGGTVDDVSVDALIDALESRGVVQIIAEPTLTTISGNAARFRAGGEFAYPVNQGDGVITPVYRETGITVNFRPEILPNKRILLEVEPTVSFVDPSAAGVSVNGFEAPSVSVRSANTKVEVASGQTFAIAGLYEQTFTDRSSNVPGVSAIGNRQQVSSERELIIFITPYLTDARRKKAPAAATTPIVDRIGFILK